jgi:hypothetical protein
MHGDECNSDFRDCGRALHCGRCPDIESKKTKIKFRYTPPPGRRNDVVIWLVEQDPRSADCRLYFAMTGPDEFSPKSIHKRPDRSLDYGHVPCYNCDP